MGVNPGIGDVTRAYLKGFQVVGHFEGEKIEVL